jgi:hypothetical protein
VEQVAKIQIQKYLGAQAGKVMAQEMLKHTPAMCHICSEAVLVHPITNVVVHATKTDVRGTQVPLDWATMPEVQNGCDIQHPCSQCSDMASDLQMSYYNHDRNVCPISDKHIAILVAEIEREIGPPPENNDRKRPAEHRPDDDSHRGSQHWNENWDGRSRDDGRNPSQDRNSSQDKNRSHDDRRHQADNKAGGWGTKRKEDNRSRGGQGGGNR